MPQFLVLTTTPAPGCPAGSAVNRVQLEDAFDPWPGYEMVPDDGRPLWMPAPAVPESVTNFQVRAVLLTMAPAGGEEGRTLLDDVDVAVRAEGGVAFQAWEYAPNVERNGLLVAFLGERMGLGSEQLDQLFIAAAGFSA